MKKILIAGLIALGAYGAEPAFELSKERDLEDSIVLRYSGKKCQTPQDKIEGCVEVAVYRPKSLDDSFIPALIDMFKKAYTLRPDADSVEVNYANVITKTFKDNQVNEINLEVRVEMNVKTRGFKGSTKNFYSDLFYHTFRKNGKMHGLTEVKLEYRDTLGLIRNLNENFHLYFYEGEEISKWLARVNPKECETKADMKGTCQYQEDKQLTVYINGDKFAKIGNYGRYVEGMDLMLQRINIMEKGINELEEVRERVY